jgi:hypothetical protein
MRRPPRTTLAKVANQLTRSRLTDDFDELMSRPDTPTTPKKKPPFSASCRSQTNETTERATSPAHSQG